MRTHFTAWGLLALSLSLFSFPTESFFGRAEAQDVAASAQAEAERLSAAARNEVGDGPLEVEPSLLVAQATGEASVAPAEKKGIISFNDAELPIVLKYIHDKTGKAVLKGPGLDEKKISLINTKEQTDRENLNLLYRVLAAQGIIVVESGDLIQVLTQADARKTDMRVVDEVPPDTELEQPIVFSRPLKSLRNGEVIDRLKPFVRDPDSLFYDASTNSILYTDTRSYVQKLERLLDMVDREQIPQTTTLYRQIKNASAVELVEPSKDFLTMYASLARGQSSQSVVQAEPETNTLIFKGPSDEVTAVSEVILRLDEASWNDLPRVVQKRALNGKDPEPVIAEAKKHLTRHVAVEGQAGDFPTTTFYFDSLTRQLVLKGPQPELDALTQILDRVDPPLAERARTFLNMENAEEKIGRALEMYIEEQRKAGWDRYEPKVTWEVDSFDTSKLTFRGPTGELDRLFAILDQIDKPLERRIRRYNNRPPDVAIPKALEWMLEDYAEQGRPGYKHSISWELNPRNQAEVILRGPVDELNRLAPLLELADPATVKRNRSVANATPEEVIPLALDLVVEEMAEEGFAGYETSTVWERDQFNPTTLVFEGPAAELDRLFALLDRLDKPTQKQTRRFYNQSMEQVIPEAIALMVKQYEEEGWTKYEHAVRWKVNPRNSAEAILEAPAEELARLAPLIEQLDKPTAPRPRQFYTKAPEDIVPVAIDLLVEAMAEQGTHGYKPSIKWERDTFDSKAVRFFGPAAELDLLFPFLDKLDPPLTVQRYSVVNATPESLIRASLDRLKQYFVDNNRPDYQPISTIRVDEGNRSLVVRGPSEETTQLLTILAELDRVQWQHQTPTTQTFYLGYAKAEDLIQAASEYLAARVAFEGKPGDEPGVSYKVIPETKTLILHGPTTQLSLVTELMNEIEKDSRIDRKPILVFPKFTSATQLYTELTQALSGIFTGAGAPLVRQNDRLGVLVLTAREEDLPVVKEWIERLDVPAQQNFARELVRLKNADPTTLSSLLTQLVTTGGRIIPDARSGSLVIIDSTESIQRMKPFIEQLDQLEDTEKMISRVIKLKTANASYLYTALNSYSSQLASSRGRSTRNQTIISYEPYSGTILLFGPEEDVTQIEKIVKDLDKVELAGREPEFIYLKNAQASQVSSVLQSMLSSMSLSQTPPLVVPETRINAIIVSAREEVMPKVRDLIEKLDVSDSEGLELKIVKLKAAGAYYIYQTLSQFKSPRGIVYYDPNTNTVIIRDIPSSIELFDKMIVDLEKIGGQEGEIATSVRAIKNAYAGYVYTGISSFLSVRASATGHASRAGLYPEYNTNSILIFGPTEEIAVIDELIDKLDSPELTAQELHVIPLKHQPASSVVTIVSNFLYSGKTGVKSPFVTYQESTNSLLVQAHANEIEKVNELIAKLDVSADERFQFKILPVKGVSAQTVVSNMRHLLGPNVIFFAETYTNAVVINALPEEIEKVEQVIAQLSQDPRQITMTLKPVKYGNASSIYSALTQFQYVQRSQQGTSYSDVGLYYEPSTNAILIFGPTDEMKIYEALIDRMDDKEMMGQDIRVFPLKHVQSSQVYSAVYNLIATGYRGQNAPYVTYESSTNSLLVRGTQEAFDQIEKVLKTLDFPGADELEVKTFPLQWANASTLYSALYKLISTRGTIQPDPYSNSIILVDTPEMVERLGVIIQNLDVEGAGKGIVTDIRRLEYADAQTIVSSMLNSVAQQYSNRRGSRGQAQTQAYAEPSSNSIVLVGASEEIKIFNELIDHFDTPETAGGEIRFFQLRYTQADQLANQVGQLFRQRGRRASGAVETEIVADRFTNTLLAVGSDADMKRLDDLVAKLDVKGASGRQVKVIPLEGANAQQLASSLRSLSGPNGSLTADVTTNSLIVDDIPSVIEKIQEVVQELHIRGGAIAAEVRKLQFADAATLIPPLQQFITLQTARQGVGQPRLSISAETSTNSVLIFGPTSEIQTIHKLIDQLDTEDLAKFVPKIYVLRDIQATQIAPQIQQILTQTSVGLIKPIVVAEPTTNSLIVQAPETDLARVQTLLEGLDRPESGGLEIEVITLKNSSALNLARTLRSPPLSNRGTAFADPNMNTLVITDTPAAIQRVRELVQKLDSEEREIVYRVQRLENTPVGTLQTQLQQFLRHLAQLKGLTSPLTDLITDPVANSVVIYGPSDEAELLTDLLIQLDSESLRERNAEVRPLERARATETATQLNQLLSQITTGPNAPRVVANEETNSLLIMATPADMTLIDDLIQGLDADDAGLRQARVYPLKHAISTTLLPTLRGLVGPTAEISAHADSNSIVYTDTSANVDKVFRLIEELDQGSRMEDVVSRVVSLENTDAVAVTTPLQTIVTQANSFKQRGNKPPVQVSPQIEANAVLIVGASDDVEQIAQIVRELDAESFSERAPEFFSLEWARAQEVATELTQLFTQTRDVGLAPKIVANEWANALMVMADPKDMEMIRKMVKQLDTREGRQRIIKIFPLENAEAYLLAPRIQELFQGGTTRSSGRQTRRSYDYYDYMYGGSRRSRAMTEGEVSIVEDQRLNALIVTAEPQDMEMVAEMIDKLDIEAPYSETPRVYTLKNAEAEDIAETLTELFADTDYVQGRYWGMDREVSVSGLSGRIRVMSVPQTNQIIVLASSPRAFEVVEEMIEELDKVSVQAGRTQTIKVKHADVVSLKKTLEELFKPEQEQSRGAQRFLFDYFDAGGGGGFGGGGSFSNLIGKVRIEADTRTSTLLVVTPELYFPDVEKLIQRLDVPTKQVLLRVLIAELTRNNERDLGIQWGVDPNTGRVGSITVDNKEFFNFDNDRGDYLNPFTEPADYLDSTNLTDPAQFVTLNSTQFGMVLNFLQTCQDIKIKQSPSITGSDNEMASIRVGSRTPFISDIDQSAGQVTSSVEYEDLGLTLEVTPHVNSATEVSLLISVTDGAIDPTIPLLLNSAATFTDRKIKTRALVENRHTIVLGGIITEEEREVIDEVPFLNHLPVVGDKLFRNRNNVKETFEILIFITPYVLNDGIDSQVATEMYRNQSKDQGLMEIDLEGGGWMHEEEDRLRVEHAARQQEDAERRKEQEDLEFEEISVPPTGKDPWSVR